MPDNIREKKFDLKDILTFSWRIFVKRSATLVTIALAVFFPVASAFASVAELIMGQDTVRNVVNSLALQFLANLFGLPAVMAIAFTVEQVLMGNEIGFGRAFEEALSNWVKAICTCVLSSAIVSVFSLFFIVPGVIWAVYYYFAVFIVMLRGKWWIAALEHSKALVKGQWIEVFSVIFTLGLFKTALFMAAELPFTSEALGVAAYPSVNLLLYAVESIITTFFTVAAVVYFLNIDYRKCAVPADSEKQL